VRTGVNLTEEQVEPAPILCENGANLIIEESTVDIAFTANRSVNGGTQQVALVDPYSGRRVTHKRRGV
jgi:hypothetical protein